MANQRQVRVKIFSSSKRQKTYDLRDENQIADLINKDVLPKVKQDYHSVNVKVQRGDDGKPKSLLAYMLRSDSYTADVTKIEVDKDLKVKNILENYDDSMEVDDEAEQESEMDSVYADYDSADFVVGTPCPDIPTAKEAVETVAKYAKLAGFTPKILVGSDATVANYQHYLKSGVFGFYNVGHGYPGGIILDDGRLRSTWFDGLANRKLLPAVVYFNSCEVHNAPLEPAIMAAGARTYIGGIVNLLIGPSEKVSKCFWSKSLRRGIDMGKALAKCESANYPNTGDHGISGDKRKFCAGHIIVFQHANFRGHHRHIFGWENNLNHPEDRSLNDQMSSFVVLSGKWKFYRHSNYLVPLGGTYSSGEYRWVGSAGVQNDQVSSLRCIHS